MTNHSVLDEMLSQKPLYTAFNIWMCSILHWLKALSLFQLGYNKSVEHCSVSLVTEHVSGPLGLAFLKNKCGCEPTPDTKFSMSTVDCGGKHVNLQCLKPKKGFTVPLRWKYSLTLHKIYYGQDSSTSILSRKCNPKVSCVSLSATSNWWLWLILYGSQHTTFLSTFHNKP